MKINISTLELTYQEYLTTELWRIIRNRVLKRDGNKCQICHYDNDLQVHHKSYDKDTIDGIDLSKLITLCRECHSLIEFDNFGNKNTLEIANTVLKVVLERFNNPLEMKGPLVGRWSNAQLRRKVKDAFRPPDEDELQDLVRENWNKVRIKHHGPNDTRIIRL